jgi:pyruvate formate lyase activating enzyme
MDFLIDLFKKAKEQGVHTNIDTSGAVFTKEEPFFGKLQELLKYTDMLMLDIKHMDAEEHRKLTGQDNEKILAFARYLDEKQIPVWIRHVVVPGITFQREELEALGRFLATLSNVEKLEVLPYHSMGKVKYDNLGIDYVLKDTPQLTKAEAKSAESIILEAMRQARNV